MFIIDKFKFMRKTAIEKTKEELELEEKNQEISEEHWYLNIPESIKSKSK